MEGSHLHRAHFGRSANPKGGGAMLTLNQPLVITDGAKAKVWDAAYEAFGKALRACK